MACRPLGELCPRYEGQSGWEVVFGEVDNFENAVNVSGKLGGVAGVLAGVHIWKLIENLAIRKYQFTFMNAF